MKRPGAHCSMGLDRNSDNIPLAINRLDDLRGPGVVPEDLPQLDWVSEVRSGLQVYDALATASTTFGCACPRIDAPYDCT